jgi:hypothetical protein
MVSRFDDLGPGLPRRADLALPTGVLLRFRIVTERRFGW